MSLFGGGTDYKAYYERYGTTIIGFAIDKYVYVSLRKNHNIFDYKSRITYSVIENVKENDEIQNPGVQGTLKYFELKDGVTICIQGDLPARTGIGSSSSMIVGLIKAIDEYNQATPRHKTSLANTAIYVERDLLQEPGGIQDQIWAAYGGVNSIQIHKDGGFSVRPLPISEEFLEKLKARMVLCHTGFSRNSFHIAGSHDHTNSDVVSIKGRIADISNQALRAFEYEDIENIADLLDTSWKLKKSVSTEISNEFIDGLYNRSREHGALGGKLLGAGGNGFMLFILKDTDKERFLKEMQLESIDFNYAHTGSELILP